MPTKTKIPNDINPQPKDNADSSEFNKLVDHNFSVEEKKAMEKRAKEGSEQDLAQAEGDDKLPIGQAEKVEAGKLKSEPDDDKSYYKKPEKDEDTSFSSMAIQKMGGNKWKRNAAIGGGASVALVTIIVSLFGFLNVFKLDGLVSNIDQKAFMRNDAAYDKMSAKMMRQYIIIRMAENEIPGDTQGKDNRIIVRANSVSINPLFNWYYNMRASSFEKDLFEKHGIKFVSIMEQGKVRKAGIVFIKDQATMTDEDLVKVRQAITNGDWRDLNTELRIFIDERVFERRADFRTKLDTALRDVLRDKSVFERRHVRKAITNMLGYRSWRFFSDTQDKVDQKQLNIRNKIVNAMLPEKIKSGGLVRCLFGLDRCRGNVDASAPENRADGLNIVDGRIMPDEVTTDPNDPDAPNKPTEYNEILSKILKKAGVVLTIIDISSTLDMLSNFDKQVSTLYKTVLIARGTQAMGLYQVMKTSRDQIKNGNVNPTELNQFMQTLDNAGGSEGWAEVVNGQGDASALNTSTKAQEYCSPEKQAVLEKNPIAANKEYVYLCPDKQIGSASTAQAIQDGYNKSIGAIIGPIVDAWDEISGGIFGTILRAFNQLISSILDPLIGAVLNILGIRDDVDRAMKWIVTEAATFVGAGPILSDCDDVDKNGSKDCWDPAGVYFNWMVQGGAYTAESTSRHLGASASTPVTIASTIRDVEEYQSNKLAQMSFFERTLSFSNPDSIGFKFSHAVADNITNPKAALSKFVPGIWNTLTGNLQNLVSTKAEAKVTKAYRASSFAGIDTYDFPTHCYGRELINTEPKNGTNIQEVLGKIGVTVTDDELTWDLVTNNNLFYDFLYEKIGDYNVDNPSAPQADDIAVQVYNCNLLDNAVRGSMGYLYGFTKDYGLEDGGVGSLSEAEPTTAAGAEIEGNVFQESVSIACAPQTKDLGVVDGYSQGQLIKIRVCALPNLSSTSEESVPGSRYYIEGADRKAIVNSRVSGAWYALMQAATSDGINTRAGSSFRTMQHQQDICSGNSGCSSGTDYGSVAKPGNSPHQLGLAIDFGDIYDSVGGNAGPSCNPQPRQRSTSPTWAWLRQNAFSKFGIKQYCAEAWHWDTTNYSNRIP